MPDSGSALVAIALMAGAAYLTRVAGVLLGGRVAADSLATRVLDVLPGAALAGVLALALAQVSWPDRIAVLIAVGAWLWRRNTLLAIGVGLAIAVGHAHVVA